MLLALSPESNDIYTVSGFWIGVVGLVIGLGGLESFLVTFAPEAQEFRLWVMLQP